jgi:hypothetical protein
VIAVSVALARAKADTQWYQTVHQRGRDLFRELPKDATSPLIQPLKGITADYEIEDVAKLVAAA